MLRTAGLRTARLAALALTLGAVAAPRPAAAAHHEPVVQVVTVEVMPGMLDAYRGEVKKLAGVLARLGSKAAVRMWDTLAGGSDAGTILVGIEWPNQEAWAADSAKLQGDAEWQRIVAGLSALRKLESSSIWRDVSPNPVQGGAAGGGILVITGVALKPGKLAEYRTRIGSGQAITERLGLQGRFRVWQAELAGPNTGAVAVGVQYPDLASYVAEQAKLDGDAEWQQLIAGLDEIRTLQGRWLYREITP